MAFVDYAVLLLALGSVLLIGAWSLITGIGPMPTSRRVREIMLAEIDPMLDGPIIEAGAGWGTLALPLARYHPGRQIRAIELSPLPWLFCRLRARCSGLANLTVRRANFFNLPLGEAAAVVCYLYPGAMTRLREKFDAELRPGTIVVSNSFAVPGWQAIRSLRIGGLMPTLVHVYVVGATAPAHPGGG